ncbi:DNA-(apurinic or apyrimidinic site) endonuclease isoform X2 [Ahaetulla prasina]|nr:DNA-(apurinic or apyrimidinic site) endonuclease isoform X2 [Ahaetulla prasina]
MPKREKSEDEILPVDKGSSEPEPKKFMKEREAEKLSEKQGECSFSYQDPPDKLTSPSDKKYTLKITSWNIDGIRAWFKKNGLEWVKKEDPDVLCFQETKCVERQLPAEIIELAAYPHKFWACSIDKDGYSGVGLLSKNKPLDVIYGIGEEDYDKEGRVITGEFDSYFLVTAYVPNAGRGLVRLEYRQRWDVAFRSYLEGLAARKPVILCGDLNVAHQEIDLKNPRGNKKSAGFTPEERAGFTQLLEAGFVDTFRHLYPDATNAYTFWTYMMNSRAKNVGWRLDYFIISKSLVDGLCDSKIRSSVLGSDHCPITLYMAI